MPLPVELLPDGAVLPLHLLPAVHHQRGAARDDVVGAADAQVLDEGCRPQREVRLVRLHLRVDAVARPVLQGGQRSLTQV